MLEKHPEIKIVHLESKGGRRLVGYSLAGLFEERGISTFVEGTCASACTTAFLGGRKRLLHPSGHLMFHVARHIPGRNHKFSGAVKTRMNRTFMEEHGIPLWFINKALSTPPEDVWTPTHSELLEAGILTAISSTPSYWMWYKHYAVDLHQIWLRGKGRPRLCEKSEKILAGCESALKNNYYPNYSTQS